MLFVCFSKNSHPASVTIKHVCNNQPFLTALVGSLGFVGQGWRSGESTHLPPVWPGFNPGVDAICGLSLLLVLFLPLRGFSPGTPVSPLLRNWPFKFDQESDRRRTIQWMCYLWIIIYLFNLFIKCKSIFYLYPSQTTKCKYSLHWHFNTAICWSAIAGGSSVIYLEKANLCWRHCLHFCSLAYDLTHRRQLIWAPFSVLQRNNSHRKLQKLLSGKNVDEPIYSLKVKFRFFKHNFSESIRYIGLKFSKITEIIMLFQYSENLF